MVYGSSCHLLTADGRNKMGCTFGLILMAGALVALGLVGCGVMVAAYFGFGS